jgi:hypothetical protein
MERRTCAEPSRSIEGRRSRIEGRSGVSRRKPRLLLSSVWNGVRSGPIRTNIVAKGLADLGVAIHPCANFIGAWNSDMCMDSAPN